MLPPILLFVIANLAPMTWARDVPPNLRNFYNAIKARGDCSFKLATGFWSSPNGPNTFSYCGDHANDKYIVYIKGQGQAFANMDVDCDGNQGGPPDDGRCRSWDTKDVTSFQAIVQGYNKGIQDLNANIHPYVVFGNAGNRRRWATFKPQRAGIMPLSIVAVVCGNQLIYGIWGDINGDDSERPVVGEASISLATACYGSGMTADAGHDENDVLYIAFRGPWAVPGADGANWAARNFAEFERSIESLGNALVALI